MRNRPVVAADLNALSGLASELASTLVALSSDIALVIDSGGAVRSVVQGTAPIAPGASEWVGRHWADTVTGDTRKKIEQLLIDVQTAGVGRQREVNLPGDQGATIPVSYAAVRLGDSGPVLAVGRDLRAIAAIQQRFTDSQQQMERDYWKRRQSESRYRALFQVATDAVLVVDALTMSVIEANHAAGRLFGLALDQMVGKHATAGIDRHSWPAVEELLNTARATGRAAEIRARVAADANAVDISATPFRSERDLLLMVRVRQVSQRTIASDLGSGEKPAADGSAQWADLVRRMPDAVVITDSSGRALSANPAFASLCQLSETAQAEGCELSRWLGADTLAALLAQAKRQGIAAQPSVSLRGSRGGATLVAISAALLDDGDRECVGFTIRRLDEIQATPLAVEEVAIAIDALADQMGRQSLSELVRDASSLAERYLVKLALQRTGGDTHAAALLLGVSVEVLMERVRLHSMSDAGNDSTLPHS